MPNSMSQIQPSITRYPKIIIQYCNKCKWQNRAIWYLQEILQTFPDLIKDISIQPLIDPPGTFQIILIKDDSDVKILYKRKSKNDTDQSYIYEGFPDSKFVKNLIKQEYDDINIGSHLSRNTNGHKLNNGEEKECMDCLKA